MVEVEETTQDLQVDICPVLQETPLGKKEANMLREAKKSSTLKDMSHVTVTETA